MENPIRIQTGAVEVFPNTDAFFSASGKVFPPGVVLYYMDGPNAGKNKLSNGIDIPNDLPFIEDLGGGDVGDLAADVAEIQVDVTNLLDERAKNMVWVFSTTITDSDPGAGVIRFNNGTMGDVSSIFIDNQDQAGCNQTGWIDKWSGRLVLQELYYRDNDGTWDTSANTIVFKIISVESTSGYRRVATSYVQGTLPAANALLKVVQIGQNSESYFAEYGGADESINGAYNEGNFPGLGGADNPTWSRANVGDYTMTIGELIPATQFDVSVTILGSTPLMHSVNITQDATNTYFNFLLTDASGTPQDATIKVKIQQFV